LIYTDLNAVVSGDDRLDVARKALQLGAAHYLVKPVRFNNLNNLLQFVNQGNKGKEMSFLGEKGSASAQEANKAPGKKNIAWTSQIHAQFLEAIRCIGAESK
jgi:response regulator of citrate/malate metabolism